MVTSTEPLLTISDLHAQTGVAPSALRFYERKRLLAPVDRRGGKRVYDGQAVEQIALIDLLKRAGFTLAEIAAFVDRQGRPAAGWRDRAAAKLAELDRALEEVEQARTIVRHTIDCPHDSLADCPVHREVLQAHAASLRAGDDRTPSSAARAPRAPLPAHRGRGNG